MLLLVILLMKSHGLFNFECNVLLLKQRIKSFVQILFMCDKLFIVYSRTGVVITNVI